MISKRIQFLKDADLRGEILEVINRWDDTSDGEHLSELDRLSLVEWIAKWLAGKSNG